MAYEDDTERRAFLLGAIVSCFGGAAFAQSNSKILEELARAAIGRAVTPGASTPATSTTTGGLRGGTGLNLTDADGGMRQALGSAALSSALRLGRLDGYWADNKVQIPLPSPLSSIQARLKPLRLSAPLDNFQMRLNRSAETSASKAGTIFTDVIKSITLADAIQLVRGGDTAGTEMLKERAGVQLTSLMTPPMGEAVEASGAGAALDRVNARYGREIERLGGFRGLAGYGTPTPSSPAPASATPTPTSGPLIFGAGATPTTTSSTPASSTGATPASTPQQSSLKNQVIGFAVSKALDGLFYYVGEEEKEIRRNPAKRTTDLLRRVFGL
jgi:hypothetical protein